MLMSRIVYFWFCFFWFFVRFCTVLYSYCTVIVQYIFVIFILYQIWKQKKGSGSTGGGNSEESLPEFYLKYVDEILEIVRENARLEFKLLWAAGLKGASRIEIRPHSLKKD